MQTDAATRQRSIAFVFGCTILGAAAQVLIKTGANNLANASPLSILTNPPLFCGYALYGVSTVLLVMALRNGQLSVLYPVISLTYVWVTMLGVMIFKERIDAFKIAGVAVIVVGVAVIGRGGKT